MKRKKNPRLARIFAGHDVAFAYLFGSQATGRTHPMSDRDIAVQFRRGVPKGRRHNLRLKLWNKLSDEWRGETIDLVDLSEAPLLLRFNAVRDGQLLYCANDRARIWFEVPTMQEYFDRQFYIERSARTAKRSVAKSASRFTSKK